MIYLFRMRIVTLLVLGLTMHGSDVNADEDVDANYKVGCKMLQWLDISSVSPANCTAAFMHDACRHIDVCPR